MLGPFKKIERSLGRRKQGRGVGSCSPGAAGSREVLRVNAESSQSEPRAESSESSGSPSMRSLAFSLAQASEAVVKHPEGNGFSFPCSSWAAGFPCCVDTEALPRTSFRSKTLALPAAADGSRPTASPRLALCQGLCLAQGYALLGDSPHCPVLKTSRPHRGYHSQEHSQQMLSESASRN